MYTLVYRFEFDDSLSRNDKAIIKNHIESLNNEDTIVKIKSLKPDSIIGTINKPSYDKMGKKLNPRNSWALIKKIKKVTGIKSTKISIINNK